MNDRLLRRRDVEATTSLSRTTIWRKVKAGTFPPPRILGPQLDRWPESWVDAWKVHGPNWRAALPVDTDIPDPDRR